MAVNPDNSISTTRTLDDESAASMLESANYAEKQKSEDQMDTEGAREQPSDSPSTIDNRSQMINKRDSEIWREAEEVGKLKALGKACEAGDLGTVQFLVHNVVSNIELINANYSDGGLTPPLHVASKNGHRQIVKFFLEQGASVMMEDQARNTPLHLAAAYGHVEVAVHLLTHEAQHNEEVSESERSNLLQLTNASGLSPFGCAMKASQPHFHVAKEFLNLSVGNPAHVIPDFSKLQLFSTFATLPLDKPAKIFVVGDSNTGKSTIVKSLQEGKPGFPRRIIGLIASRLVMNVDDHFSGIITTDFANADFRRVLFYDLAGHTNYFNEHLLEPGDNIEHVVFIVMINLQYNRQKAAERLIYWLNFLHYYTSGFSNDSTKPSIIVVGSHKDMRRGAWRSGEKFNEVYTEALTERPQLSACFNELMKPVCFDCRRFELSEARQLRSCLHKHCQSGVYQQLEATSPPSACYILSQVLFDDKEIPPYLTISKLAERISELSSKPDISLYKLLPTEPEKLMKICRTLCERDRLLIFENPAFPRNDRMCWVVHNMHALLTEIDKRLATLKDSTGENPSQAESVSTESMPQKISHFHFGIVTRERLESVFSHPGSPKITRKGSVSSNSKVSEIPSPNIVLNSNLAIDLLIKYKYCEVMKKSGIISPEMESFFFPGLLRNEGEPEPWEPGTNYSFAWCVLATREDGKIIEYFLPRFLKKLLLCFIEKYIIQTTGLEPTDDTSSRSSCNETSAVWSRGVSWLTNDDIRVNIELDDNAIILSMYSPQGSELNCLQLRNKILATIKAEQMKWQPDIATKEFIIPFEEKFPVQTLDNHQRISLESVKTAILKHKMKVNEVELRSLLFFEPCMSLSELVPPIQELLCDAATSSTSISQENISDIFDEFGESRSAVIQHFSLPDPSSNTRSQVKSSMDTEEGSTHNSITPTSSVELSKTADESSYSSITPKVLIECLNSISIMDVTEFLKQLKECEPATPSTQSSSPVSDGPHYDSESDARKNSTLTRTNLRTCSTFLSTSNFDLPFIESPSVLKCSSVGQVYVSKEHGIKLVFPPGAVPKGTVNVEIGVLLSGPFTFPANFKPVSPILWLNVKQNQCHKFSKSITITLPHYVDCNSSEEEKGFAFFKAAHDHTDSFMDQPFTFKEFNSDSSKLTRGSGTMMIKQCCFISIAYKESEDMIEKSNYCLLSVVPKTIYYTSVFNMHFCLTVHLKTCIEVVRKQFPECEIYNKKVFKFAQQLEGSQTQYAITIHFDNHLPNDWIIGNIGFGNKISASKIDFFKNEPGHLHLLEDDERYPPRFTLEINGSSATKAALLCVNFTGATEEMQSQKTLPMFCNQLSGSLDRISRRSEDSLVAMDALPSPAGTVGNNILDQHLGILINCLHVDKVRPKLRQYGVFLPGDSEKLIDLSTHHNTTLESVIERLVTILSSKGASGLYYFRKSLEETTDGTGHQDILKELQEDTEFAKIVSDFHDQLSRGTSQH